jgi:hypothetical protein
MAFAGHQHDHALGADEKQYYNPAESPVVDNGLAPQRTFQPPELVRLMSPEQRLIAEAHLRRKIDLRLLPMVVIMYIMNYLDRNNIAAARLGGLEKDLNLSSVEYSVRSSILNAICCTTS